MEKLSSKIDKANEGVTTSDITFDGYYDDNGNYVTTASGRAAGR